MLKVGTLSFSVRTIFLKNNRNHFLHKLPTAQWNESSTACGVISFSGQGQLCPLTCEEWRHLSNHARMSTIQPRTPEKKAKNHVTLTWKFPWKSCSTTHLPFLSCNPKILKAFLKLFTPKWSLLNAQREKRKMRQGKRKKRGGEKPKLKVDCFVTFKPKKPNLEFLLSAHAQTWQANILYMDQKAGKCTTCKRLCKKF